MHFFLQSVVSCSSAQVMYNLQFDFHFLFFSQAILEVGDVLQFYDSDKRFPAWGFGARPIDGPVSHCFNLNGSTYQPEVILFFHYVITIYKSMRRDSIGIYLFISKEKVNPSDFGRKFGLLFSGLHCVRIKNILVFLLYCADLLIL